MIAVSVRFTSKSRENRPNMAFGDLPPVNSTSISTDAEKATFGPPENNGMLKCSSVGIPALLAFRAVLTLLAGVCLVLRFSQAAE